MTQMRIMGGATAALLLSAALVSAADLGGNCCADLEERVAELEATVARKGNRKVSLTISGVVHKGILSHDNDDLPGANKLSIYDGTQDPSRFRFAGEGRIGKDTRAGFVIEIAIANPSARGIDAGNAVIAIPDSPDGKNEVAFGEVGTTTRHSYVYLDTVLGTVSVGHTSMATDGIIELSTANTNLAVRPLSLMPLNFGGAVPFLNLPYDGGRANVVRYDTPILGGFTASVTWSDTDTWDAALRYAAEFGEFRFAAGIGYRDQKPQTLANVLNVLNILTLDVTGSHKALSGSASLMHTKTGLFATGFYSRLDYDLTGVISLNVPLIGGSVSASLGSERVTGYGGQAGIQRNWTGWGATTLFAEWQKMEQLTGDDLKVIGAGAIQSIDGLALDVYGTVRRLDVGTPTPLCLGVCSDTTLFMLGTKISF